MRLLPSLVVLVAACAGGEPSQPGAAPVAGATAAAPVAGATTTAAPKPAALAGDVYGAGVTLTESVPVSKLLAEADQYDGKRVRVEGLVTEVCAKRGCWMNIAGDDPYQALRFKVEDGVITIPLEAKGRYAVAEGIARKVLLSPEDAAAMREHEAEEQGRPVDTTTPLPGFIVKLEGTGAVIRDRS